MKRAAVVIALLVAVDAGRDVAAEAKVAIAPPRPALELYSHVLPGMQEDATVRVDDAQQAAINRRPAAIR